MISAMWRVIVAQQVSHMFATNVASNQIFQYVLVEISDLPKNP
jgi:hypothetical protein